MAGFIPCNRCEYEENCSLKAIADDLDGCSGHSKVHHRYTKHADNYKKEFDKKRAEAIKLNDEMAATIKVGDKLRLTGSTIALGLNLPRYLDYGVFTFLGFNRNGKAICDWDGGKPFHIPLLCLEKVEG